MALDPFKLRANFQAIPLIDLREDVLDNVLVLYSLAVGILPPIPSPIDEPSSHTVDGILAV